METETVKLSSGENFKVEGLKWKKVRELKLVSILNKYRGADNDSMIGEDDIDVVIGAIMADKQKDNLSFEDATKLFSAVVSTTFNNQDEGVNNK